MSKQLFIGLLSGTSMDAIDAALVSFDANNSSRNLSNLSLLDTLNYPIPDPLREKCLSISETGNCNIDEIGSLDASFGNLFADAALNLLKKAQVSSNQVMAIGSHGQNLRHRPKQNPPFTLQIGDPNIISEKTGILTIADFRRRDIAAGGCGAPLAPAFHASVFGDNTEDRMIVNIGGISNITFLPKDKTQPIIGFDAGPGNCLMDAWIQKQLGKTYDKNGAFASSGVVQTDLLKKLLNDPYFSLQPPKSTGREYFNLQWLNQYLNMIDLKIQDVQMTLLALTVESIKSAIQTYSMNANVFVCGGGAHNKVLIETLSSLLKREVHSTERLGIPPDWVEAMLFAWLAKQRMEGKTGNCPSVTGARNAVMLGGIF